MNADYRQATCERAIADKLPAFTARHDDGRVLCGTRKGSGWSLSLEAAHGWVNAPNPETGEVQGIWTPKTPSRERTVTDADLAKAVEEMCS